MVMRLSSTDLKDNTKLLPMNSEDFSLRKCRITTFCTFYFGKKEEKKCLCQKRGTSIFNNDNHYTEWFRKALWMYNKANKNGGREKQQQK